MLCVDGLGRSLRGELRCVALCVHLEDLRPHGSAFAVSRILDKHGVAVQTIYALNELFKLLGRGEARCAQGRFELSRKETGDVDFGRHGQRSIVNNGFKTILQKLNLPSMKTSAGRLLQQGSYSPGVLYVSI